MRLFPALALAALLPAAAAQTTPPDPLRDARPRPAVDLTLDLGVAYGGDRVATLVFTDGETQTMRAGQGGLALGGVRVRPVPALPLALRAAAGYKFMTSAAENASIWLHRFPVEAGAEVYATPDVWLGAAFTQQFGARFDGDNVVPDARFDVGPGVVAEAGWRWLAVRYTAQRYTAPNGATLDASSIGASARFGLRVR